MLEEILQLSHSFPFPDKLYLLQIRQSVLYFLDCVSNFLKKPVEEAPSNDRSNLHQIARFLFEPVNSGHQHIVDGIRNSYGTHLSCYFECPLFQDYRTLIN